MKARGNCTWGAWRVSLPGRMLGSMENCTWGAWRALLPLRMKILLGRTALKTLDLMALCTDHCLPPSFGTFSRTVILLYSGCLEICRKLLDSICRFSFLKRCNYSLYSDTMLNIGSIRMYILMLKHVLNETNMYVCMYIWRIYSSRDLDTLLYKVDWIALEKYWFIYTCNKGLRNVRIALRSQLTEENWENYNDMRNCHLSELMCEVSFHCLLCV